ncbi:hypothetical protein [Avibacterium avium]|uniref:hypothetical protein n=1 Tax=Avibacterium avium TaxID=751 RepID=UPI003BF7763E
MFKKLLIFPIMCSLSGCLFSYYMLSDEEVYNLGKESAITVKCLNLSHIPDLHNLQNKPSIGIFEQLHFLVRETVGQKVLGQRYHEIKNDWFFSNSYQRKEEVWQRGFAENININVNSTICKPYLDHYEGAYYRLKGRSY